MILLDSDQRSLVRRWGLLDGYDIIKPGSYDTVRYPPPDCITVYDSAFDLAMRFPLHPFAREVLEVLNIIIVELHPNAWGCINAFILLSRIMGLRPSLIAQEIFQACWGIVKHSKGILDKIQILVSQPRMEFQDGLLH